MAWRTAGSGVTMRSRCEFLADGGLGDQPLQRLAGNGAALLGRGFLAGLQVARRLRHLALVGLLELGPSMVWPPTLATQVVVPIMRMTSPMPQEMKAITMIRKKPRTTQVSR